MTMKALKTILLALTGLLTGFMAQSQIATFHFNTELCEYTCTFDSTKYSREQLNNTIDYLWYPPYNYYDATVWELEDIDSLSTDLNQKACDANLYYLENLPFIDNTYWEKVRQNRILENLSTCRLREFTILAYSNPDTLMSYETVDSTCIFYRDALIAGGEKLLEAWDILIQDMKSRNGYPENIQAEYEEKLASDLKYEYARLDIMMFGWWNHANRLIFHMSNDGYMQMEFEKLFSKWEVECYEP